MFRTHPDINTPPMKFHHQLSIEWEVCTPPHFNLQYTQRLHYPNWVSSRFAPVFFFIKNTTIITGPCIVYNRN